MCCERKETQEEKVEPLVLGVPKKKLNRTEKLSMTVSNLSNIGIAIMPSAEKPYFPIV